MFFLGMPPLLLLMIYMAFSWRLRVPRRRRSAGSAPVAEVTLEQDAAVEETMRILRGGRGGRP
jgi:hypothetical protein